MTASSFGLREVMVTLQNNSGFATDASQNGVLKTLQNVL
jgi:hypothetical protein